MTVLLALCWSKMRCRAMNTLTIDLLLRVVVWKHIPLEADSLEQYSNHGVEITNQTQKVVVGNVANAVKIYWLSPERHCVICYHFLL